MSNVDRNFITNKIYARLDGSVPKTIIKDSIDVICRYFSNSLKNTGIVHIHNFGTIHTYTFHGHDGVDIHSKEIKYVKPFLTAKFVPHDNFSVLLNNKRSNYK